MYVLAECYLMKCNFVLADELGGTGGVLQADPHLHPRHTPPGRPTGRPYRKAEVGAFRPAESG